MGIIIAGLSIALFLYFAVDRYFLLYYWDSVSHLVAGRKLVDWSENPGFGQIGTVWMPLPHILLLPFSLVDPLFSTGFAGLVLSLPMTALTAVILCRMVKADVGDNMQRVPTYIAIVAGLLFASNANILYLGFTSMTEAPFMLFFVLSAYFLQKWIQSGVTRLRHLLLCSIFVVLASSCRYEGWLLPLFVMGIAIYFLLKKNRTGKTERNNAFSYKNAVLFGLVSVFSLTGVVFWLAWNQYHYHNAFQFMSEKYYSASWYAQHRPFRDVLFLQPTNALSTYSISALTMYGPLVLGAAVFGFVFRKGFAFRGNNILYSFLALPPFFTIASLVVGIGELSFWFNSRFLVLLAPLAIILACTALKRMDWTLSKKVVPKRNVILAGIVGLFFVYNLVILLVPPAIITLDDAIGGFNVKDNQLAIKTGEALKSVYDGNGEIMVLTGSGVEQRIMITSGIHLRQFDEIIEGSTWKPSFKVPWLYDRYIIISNHPAADAQNTTQYWLDRIDTIKQYYDPIYQNEIYTIYLEKPIT